MCSAIIYRVLLHLLTLNFLKPVLIAMLVASPLAWYMMNTWLQDFQYKTPITWDIFALAAILSIAIATLTISYQSIKAALSRPVTGLKAE